MRKLQEILGLPVLDVSTGKNVGIVRDLYFNHHGDVMGIAIEVGGLINRMHFISFDDIGAIGEDAITIGSQEYIASIDKAKQLYGFISGKRTYKELPVVTTNGNELGHIQDVYFKEELGKIIGYEISDGFLTDITEGRRSIEWPQKMVIGEDALVIPSNEVKDVIFDKG